MASQKMGMLSAAPRPAAALAVIVLDDVVQFLTILTFAMILCDVCFACQV